MRPEVCGKGEIGIERRRPDLFLEPSQIGCLIADEGKEFLSRPVTPKRELTAVCSELAAITRPICTLV